jgi:hypothetical protein
LSSTRAASQTQGSGTVALFYLRSTGYIPDPKSQYCGDGSDRRVCTGTLIGSSKEEERPWAHGSDDLDLKLDYQASARPQSSLIAERHRVARETYRQLSKSVHAPGRPTIYSRSSRYNLQHISYAIGIERRKHGENLATCLARFWT